MVALIREAQVFRPALRAAFVINRRISTTIIGREARQALADQPLPALRSEIPETTKFIIAQRISSIQDADLILVLEGGQIDAMGTHEQLLASNRIYREVYESQNKAGGADNG